MLKFAYPTGERRPQAQAGERRGERLREEYDDGRHADRKGRARYFQVPMLVPMLVSLTFYSIRIIRLRPVFINIDKKSISGPNFKCQSVVIPEVSYPYRVLTSY